MTSYYERLEIERIRWISGEISNSEFFDHIWDHIVEDKYHILPTPRDMLWELRCAIRKTEEDNTPKILTQAR